ncbi:hypothetical protein [Candidatus Poriferisodalis sp.]|uniref:hypothetical protein n=1 Tax=Candidatus Poriferisodalis sp. TaxID=3101277 RepID=UPI003B013837
MTMAGSAGAGLVAALALNLIYRRIQSEWPQNYFSLTDYWSHVKALVPSRYIVFRFGPIVLVGIFGVRQMDALDWPVWPFAAVTFLVHAGATSLRAVWRIMRFRRSDERRGPLLVLHLVTSAAVAACLAAAMLVGDRLSALVPDLESIRDEIWAALLGSMLTFAFIRSTRAPQRTLAEIVATQRRRIGPELLSYARRAAAENGLDADVVETVLLVESIQRPQWFRRLEGLKGILFRSGSYGIMQVQAQRPIGDRASIDLALEIHHEAFRTPSQPDSGHYAPVSSQLRRYNGSPAFLELADDVHGEVYLPW